MKKLLTVAIGIGAIYILILRSIANFITRDTEKYVKALELSDADSKNSNDIQVRKEWLHR